MKGSWKKFFYSHISAESYCMYPHVDHAHIFSGNCDDSNFVQKYTFQENSWRCLPSWCSFFEMLDLKFCISDFPRCVLQLQMYRQRLIALWMLQSTDIESICPCDKLLQIEVNNFNKVCGLNSYFHFSGHQGIIGRGKVARMWSELRWTDRNHRSAYMTPVGADHHYHILWKSCLWFWSWNMKWTHLALLCVHFPHFLWQALNN